MRVTLALVVVSVGLRASVGRGGPALQLRGPRGHDVLDPRGQPALRAPHRGDQRGLPCLLDPRGRHQRLRRLRSRVPGEPARVLRQLQDRRLLHAGQQRVGGLLEGEPGERRSHGNPEAHARGLLQGAEEPGRGPASPRPPGRRGPRLRGVRGEPALDLRRRHVRHPEPRGHVQQPGAARPQVLAGVRAPGAGQRRLGEGRVRRRPRGGPPRGRPRLPLEPIRREAALRRRPSRARCFGRSSRRPTISRPRS